MTAATTRRWTKLTIWPGDGATPTEDFTSKVCGLTSKSFNLTGEVSESNTIDCDDPDLPSFVERVIRSLSSEVTGAGVMAEETFAFWRDWMLSAAAKNVRIVVELAGTPGYFAGRYVLTQFELAGNQDDGKINVSVTMQSDGTVAWVNGSP